MANLGQVILFSLIGGVFSLVGGFLLLSSKKNARRLSDLVTPFAAGALLAAAFVDLLPEASHVGDIERALIYTLAGIILFFLLERALHWFHHHHEHEPNKSVKNTETVPLIIIGDTLHNFIDGIVIAAGFLVSVETGIIVTVAVAAHEIPQEIGDFGLLLSKGMSRRNVVMVNILSALATTFAAIIFFQLGQSTIDNLDALLGLVAGFFIYIASSDIIPTIHAKNKNEFLGTQALMLIVGVVVVGLTISSLHGVIETETGHDHSHIEEHEEDEIHYELHGEDDHEH